MYAVAMIAVLIALGLAVFRALAGPNVFDRLLAANLIGTLAILLLAVLGFLNGRPEFLDVGLVYAFLNITGTYAVLKFFRYGSLGGEAPPNDNEDDREGVSGVHK
ncbi:MAG: pH regulation protein F [Rhizobiales bacterium]|nr:pH regulation protein F [Hyphomicrobiales bacterium]